MQFHNKENEKVTLPDGRIVFLSRSCAVVFCLTIHVKDQIYFLLVKRGPDCPDEIGKWCLPCGYLDWNESGTDGAKREVFEETGLDIDQLLSQNLLTESDNFHQDGRLDQPFFVNHYPHSNRQNVTLHFGVHLKLNELPVLNIDSLNRGETADVKFVPYKSLEHIDFAFGHKKVTELWMGV